MRVRVQKRGDLFPNSAAVCLMARKRYITKGPVLAELIRGMVLPAIHGVVESDEMSKL